jgi:ribosomal protein L11 methyltransferase
LDNRVIGSLLYPALDVHDADHDRILAILDDYSPTAVEEHDSFLSIFFATAGARDAARDAVARALPEVRLECREVDDEDWARRSQENLGPVTVGRITIVPPWSAVAAGSRLEIPLALPLSLTIRPSMAFGTGHHVTTRLCLVALQLLSLTDTYVLDVGTGSGVLAIAARMLGATGAVGIDHDADAIACARENLTLNPGVDRVRFTAGDLSSAIGAEPSSLYVARGLSGLGPADVVVANLTGDLLRRSATVLANAFAPGGALIVSGVLAEERDAVVEAFQGLDLVWEMEEEGWVGLGFARL